MHSHRLVFLCAIVVLTGCGTTVYRPARDAGFELDPAFEIDDADVLAAFAAQPQLPDEVRVSFYSLAPERESELAATVSAAPNVVSSYAIPSMLVTGRGRLAEPAGWPAAEPARPLSIKKLRLLSARARTDVLVVFDYGHRITSAANGWVATGVLIVPMFFAPMVDYEVESYLDAYVIDVKNGYLYAHVSSQARDEAAYETIYRGVADELLEKQWTTLESATRAKLARLLRDPSAKVPPRAAVADDG